MSRATRVRLVLAPGAGAVVRRQSAPALAAIIGKLANSVASDWRANIAAGGPALGMKGRVHVHEEHNDDGTPKAVVANEDIAGHLDEWGSRYQAPSHAGLKAARANGLKIRESRK